MSDAEPKELSSVRQLSKEQRRVLGVLVEKGFTTPEYYPMTLKALIAGCNQRSNREPVTSFSEAAVLEAVDGLSEYGLVAVVHTSGGRTERYRHYMRHKFELTERQLAILTELWLRGRQQLGELRTRAGRMESIDSQEDLRHELAGLIELGFVATNGPLERRGIEVDHTFYEPHEQAASGFGQVAPPAAAESSVPAAVAQSPSPVAIARPADLNPEVTGQLDDLQRTVAQQADQLQQLIRDMADLQNVVDDLSRTVDDLRQQLGV